MAQWLNLHRNNTFVNWMQLPLLCETSGAILLVLVHGSYGKPSDKILVDLKFSTVHIIRIFMVTKGMVLLQCISVSF